MIRTAPRAERSSLYPRTLGKLFTQGRHCPGPDVGSQGPGEGPAAPGEVDAAERAGAQPGAPSGQSPAHGQSAVRSGDDPHQLVGRGDPAAADAGALNLSVLIDRSAAAQPA